jgi:Ca2+-binding EF-hand superfamily protein
VLRILAYSLALMLPPGEITGAELGEVMKSLGLAPSESELEDLMDEIDSDRSGTISFEGSPSFFSL